jgi:RimJ/RimL family protein N-acetyltransferase
LLANHRLQNVQHVIAEIESCWPSLQQFYDKGFGVTLLLGEEEIVCWCTAEYVSAGRCGIGIETDEAYQNRGFATLTAAAFVEDCLARQVAPHWDSWTTNVPSLAVAEKVGFRMVQEYFVYLATLS